MEPIVLLHIFGQDTPVKEILNLRELFWLNKG